MATPPPRAGARSASRSPGRSMVEALPPVPNPAMPDDSVLSESPQPGAPGQIGRRGSFGFLKRGKSVERMNSKRSNSGGANKLTKRQVKEREARLAREAAMLPKEPPQIPGLSSPAPLHSFDVDGGPLPASSDETPAGRSSTAQSNPYGVPIPPIPSSAKHATNDPLARFAGLPPRGRVSYASSTVSTINSPRRVRRRHDPTPFNILVIGTRNAGKSAFVDFLVTSLAPSPGKRHGRKDEPLAQTSASKVSPTFVAHYLETDLDGEAVALTIWDSEGIEKSLADLQLREITSFVESKFEETLREEVKVARTPGVRDTHIHAVFLLLDPLRLDSNIEAAQKKTREKSSNGHHFANGRSYIHPPSPIGTDIGSLDDVLDLPILKALQGKTTVIPVISKADTIPQAHVLELKRSVGESLKQAKLDPLENLGLGDDDEEESSSSEDDLTRAVGRPKLLGVTGRQRSDRRTSPAGLEDEDDDLSHQSVLNLSSSGSSATSVAAAMPKKSPPANDTVLFLPHTVLSPYPIVAHRAITGVVGRRFAWGSADPYDTDHCDFVKVRDAVFSEWRNELREASKELWYENWRTARLDNVGSIVPRRDLSGPPTTGRGARMGAQMVAPFTKENEPQARGQSPGRPSGALRAGQSPTAAPHHAAPSPAGGHRANQSPAGGHRTTQSPAEAHRAGRSSAGAPRAAQSPAGHAREQAPAGFAREQAPRVGRSPAAYPRPGSSSASARASQSPSARAGAADPLHSNPHYGHSPHMGHSPQMGHSSHLVAPPPPLAGPLPPPPRPKTADERRAQVPWPLQ